MKRSHFLHHCRVHIQQRPERPGRVDSMINADLLSHSHTNFTQQTWDVDLKQKWRKLLRESTKRNQQASEELTLQSRRRRKNRMQAMFDAFDICENAVKLIIDRCYTF